MNTETDLKRQVQEFWDAASCGEVYAVGETELQRLRQNAEARYRLEPYIKQFARFEQGSGKDVLEIGVGMGADHAEWARHHPRSLTGIDLTPRAVAHTRARLHGEGFQTTVSVSDAENLPFDDDSFDIVYSFGVLHHSPDTARCFSEVRRVLRPGGVARVMIYHTWSLVGYMLWLRYALARGRPTRTLSDIYAQHLESPGTKAYTVNEARSMLDGFSQKDVSVQLSFGDLLEGEVGQRHRGVALDVARRWWPRPVLRRLFRGHGLYLMIEAIK